MWKKVYVSASTPSAPEEWVAGRYGVPTAFRSAFVFRSERDGNFT